MPVPYHGLDGIGIAFRTPRGHEEGLVNAEVAVGIEDTRHRDIGTIAEHRRGGDHAMRPLRMRQMQDAFGVHIERKGHRTLRSIGPGNRIGDHRLVFPPSTDQAAPVTNFAASLARKAITAATSDEVPRRPSGIEAISARRASSGASDPANSALSMAVSIGPGQTALTRIPSLASSTA